MNASSCCAWVSKNSASVGLLILRVFVAFVMISSGYGKLFGGMEMFTGVVDKLGFPLPTLFAYVAALTEFVGGIAVLLGIGTRIFAGLLAITMAVAFFLVHGASPMQGMGAFAFLGSTLCLAFAGGGRWSIGCSLCRKGSGCCCGKEDSANGCCKQ